MKNQGDARGRREGKCTETFSSWLPPRTIHCSVSRNWPLKSLINVHGGQEGELEEKGNHLPTSSQLSVARYRSALQVSEQCPSLCSGGNMIPPAGA